jgi:hypothetical protein
MDLSFEQIYEALESWRRTRERESERTRALESHLQEAAHQRKLGIDTLRHALSMPATSSQSFQQVVEEALRVMDVRMAEKAEEAEKNRIEAATARAHVQALEAERDKAIDDLTKALEIPASRTRSLGNVVMETIGLIEESKRMVRERL